MVDLSKKASRKGRTPFQSDADVQAAIKKYPARGINPALTKQATRKKQA